MTWMAFCNFLGKFNGKSCWGVQGGASPLANFGDPALTIYNIMLIHISTIYLDMSILFCTFVTTKEIVRKSSTWNITN